MTPIHYRTKLRRAGLPLLAYVMPQCNAIKGGRPRKDGKRMPCGRLSKATGGKRTGRPITSTHKRAKYWREWRRKE